MLANVEHVNAFDTLPLWISVGWIVMAVAGLCFGAKIFNIMIRLPACVPRGPWYMLAYGMTGYGVARLGWVFDAEETARMFWGPLIYITGLVSLVGSALAITGLVRRLPKFGSRRCALCENDHR